MIFILILILILIGIILFFCLRPKNEVNQELIDQYYSFLGSNDLSLCDGLYLYADKKINTDLVSNTQKMCNAYLTLNANTKEEEVLKKSTKGNYCTYKNIKFATDEYKEDKCTITKIKAEDLLKQVQNIYHMTIEKGETFKVDDNLVCTYKDDYFYCGLAENFLYSLKETPNIYRSIIKTKESEDKLEIYDYFIKIVSDKCYANFTTTEDNSKCSQKYAAKKQVDYSFLKKYGTTYKHTFLKDKDSNTYYWVATEPVK